MSSVDPSSEVPMACIRYLTRSCAASRRWISAMYSLALTCGRPRASTVRSAVAICAGYARSALPALEGVDEIVEHGLGSPRRVDPKDYLVSRFEDAHREERAAA